MELPVAALVTLHPVCRPPRITVNKISGDRSQGQFSLGAHREPKVSLSPEVIFTTGLRDSVGGEGEIPTRLLSPWEVTVDRHPDTVPALRAPGFRPHAHCLQTGHKHGLLGPHVAGEMVCKVQSGFSEKAGRRGPSQCGSRTTIQ